MSTPLIAELRKSLGRDNVLSAPSELAVYDCDAFTIERHRPRAVVFPRSTEQVAEAVRICGRHGAAVVARGAGTSLAGGCLPLGRRSDVRHSDVRHSERSEESCVSRDSTEILRCAQNDEEFPARERLQDAVVVMLTRMNKILDIDLRNRMAVVEAGVQNLRLTQALAGTGYHFAPDPSSQAASTIGGNVATNAGGPHTLKYGVTVNHVLGLEAVLSDGAILRLGPVADSPKPDSLDLIGVLVGSEGTLAIVTKIWVRLTPNPQDYRTLRATFNSLDDAGNAVSAIIAAGIVPAAMELMDQGILSAVEDAYHFGFPSDAGAVLVIEVDGPTVGLDRQQEQIVELCRRFGAREVLQAATAAEREMLWKCRKMAVGATGRLSPSYTIQDGVVPRTKLPQIISRTAKIAKKYGIRIVNVAHAGDGNVHPILLFDERDRRQVERVVAAGREILEECITAGGSITAEHGIGVEKLSMMGRLFTPADLAAMRGVRAAFDPLGIFNPGKTIPVVGEEPQVMAHGSALPPTEEGNRLIDYPADDMTITVEAGMTVAELNRHLAEHRQWLPIDVARPEQTTVGGAIAVNASGPRRFVYGTMRDYLLGFTAVDGRGATFSGGGRVVKNAAGYNMCRLMAGSRGTLAVLTQATLMVRPRPETAALLACEFADFDLAEKLLAGLIGLPVRPVAVELSAGRDPRTDCPCFGPIAPGNAGRLCVGFEGGAEETAWMLDRLREGWTALGMTSPVIMPELPTDAIWRWFAEFPANATLGVLPSRLVETVAELLKESPDCAIQSRAGDGVICVHQENSRGPTARGGATSKSDETLRGPLAPDYCDDSAIRVMQAIKERFDPQKILNPHITYVG